MSEAISREAMPCPAPTARLEARFASVRGKTQLAGCFAQAPLKIAKTFPQESCVGVCVMDASPGLLAGDDYLLSWQLGPGARVFVTTQGFTRVHPSRERPCRLRQNLEVAEDALLEYFPEPLMLYKDAALRSQGEVRIARGGTLLMSEIVCAGRIGHHEEFQFAHFENRLRAYYDDKLIFVNQTSLRPPLFGPRRVGAWQDFTHQGSFFVFAEGVNGALRDALREVLGEAQNAGVWGGVSLLERYGVAANFMGRRACDLQSVSQQLRATTLAFLS